MGHFGLPSVCPAQAPLVNVSLPADTCFIVFDRHVEKNGGSTLRSIFQWAEAHGDCAYMGYALEPLSWHGLLRGLHRVRDGAPAPRLCIEGHNGGDVAGVEPLEALAKVQR